MTPTQQGYFDAYMNKHAAFADSLSGAGDYLAENPLASMGVSGAAGLGLGAAGGAMMGGRRGAIPGALIGGLVFAVMNLFGLTPERAIGWISDFVKKGGDTKQLQAKIQQMGGHDAIPASNEVMAEANTANRAAAGMGEQAGPLTEAQAGKLPGAVSAALRAPAPAAAPATTPKPAPTPRSASTPKASPDNPVATPGQYPKGQGPTPKPSPDNPVATPGQYPKGQGPTMPPKPKPQEQPEFPGA